MSGPERDGGAGPGGTGGAGGAGELPGAEEFERGVTLFNRREFFASHETWEALLAPAAAGTAPALADESFLRAMIQLAAGLHLRFERGSSRGARNLLQQALVLLEDYRPAHRGVDVERLFDEVAEYAERLDRRRGIEAGWLDRWLAPRIPRRFARGRAP